MALVFTLPQLRFKAGQLVMTLGVHALIQQNGFNPSPYLHRHLNGDWGDLCASDKQRNDSALKSGERLFSSYEVTPDLTIWIITEGDRSVTTILLPSEY